jgi:hypothetical protein
MRKTWSTKCFKNSGEAESQTIHIHMSTVSLGMSFLSIIDVYQENVRALLNIAGMRQPETSIRPRVRAAWARWKGIQSKRSNES